MDTEVDHPPCLVWGNADRSRRLVPLKELRPKPQGRLLVRDLLFSDGKLIISDFKPRTAHHLVADLQVLIHHCTEALGIQ